MKRVDGKFHRMTVLSFLRKQESSFFNGFWTPAFVGVTSFFSTLSELRPTALIYSMNFQDTIVGSVPPVNAYFGNSNVPMCLVQYWLVPGAIDFPEAMRRTFPSPLIPFHLPVPCRNLQWVSAPSRIDSMTTKSPSGSMYLL